MKKLFTLIICLLFIPVVFAKDKVEIEAVELDSKSDGVIINKEATFKELSISSDISFKNVGDYVKYKVTVANNSEKEFIVNNKNEFDKSDYIKYEFDTFDSIKPNAKSIIYLTISYNNKIDENKFVNDRYNELKNAAVELVTSDGTNPNTSTNTILFVSFFTCFLIALICFMLMKKNVKYLSVILVLIAVPMMVKAIESLIIKVNVSVSVPRTYKVVYRTIIPAWYSEEEKQALEDDSICYAREYYDNDGNRYYVCPYRYEYEDPTKYYGGEKVTVLSLKKAFNACDGIWDITNGSVICRGEIKQLSLSIFDEGREFAYGKNYQDNIGFGYNDDDVYLFDIPEDRKEQVIEQWNRSREINLVYDMTFTMPKHDMLFVYLVPES